MQEWLNVFIIHEPVTIYAARTQVNKMMGNGSDLRKIANDIRYIKCLHVIRTA